MTDIKRHVNVCDNCEFYKNADGICEKNGNNLVEKNFYCEYFKCNTYAKELRNHVLLELKDMIRGWRITLSPMTRTLSDIAYKMINLILDRAINNKDSQESNTSSYKHDGGRCCLSCESSTYKLDNLICQISGKKVFETGLCDNFSKETR